MIINFISICYIGYGKNEEFFLPSIMSALSSLFLLSLFSCENYHKPDG